MQKTGVLARKIFLFLYFVRKSLTINDLRRPPLRNPLTIKDLRNYLFKQSRAMTRANISSPSILSKGNRKKLRAIKVWVELFKVIGKIHGKRGDDIGVGCVRERQVDCLGNGGVVLSSHIVVCVWVCGCNES